VLAARVRAAALGAEAVDTSIRASARAATTFPSVPPLTPTFTEIPGAPSPRPLIRRTWCASSSIARSRPRAAPGGR
jgi:hypothetical protein